MRHGIARAGAVVGPQAAGGALVRRPDAAGRSSFTAWASPAPAGRGAAGAGPRDSGGRRPAVYPPPLGTASFPKEEETAAEVTSMPSGRGRWVGVLGASRHPAASWREKMLSTAAWLVGRRVYQCGCRWRAEQLEEAKALEVSRYAQEREARAGTALRP